MGQKAFKIFLFLLTLLQFTCINTNAQEIERTILPESRGQSSYNFYAFNGDNIIATQSLSKQDGSSSTLLVEINKKNQQRVLAKFKGRVFGLAPKGNNILVAIDESDPFISLPVSSREMRKIYQVSRKKKKVEVLNLGELPVSSNVPLFTAFSLDGRSLIGVTNPQSQQSFTKSQKSFIRISKNSKGITTLKEFPLSSLNLTNTGSSPSNLKVSGANVIIRDLYNGLNGNESVRRESLIMVNKFTGAQKILFESTIRNKDAAQTEILENFASAVDSYTYDGSIVYAVIVRDKILEKILSLFSQGGVVNFAEDLEPLLENSNKPVSLVAIKQNGSKKIIKSFNYIPKIITTTKRSVILGRTNFYGLSGSTEIFKVSKNGESILSLGIAEDMPLTKTVEFESNIRSNKNGKSFVGLEQEFVLKENLVRFDLLD